MNSYLLKAFFLFTLVICSCSNGPVEGKAESNDSLGVEDSSELYNPQIEARKLLVQQYKTPIKIDTTFEIGDSKYIVTLIHACTLDSSIIVPAKYNFDTQSAFVTHAFQSQLFVLKNTDTILNKRITKQEFTEVISEELRSFGVIQFPNIGLSKNNIDVSYSLSIPATDVGMNVAIAIDTTGKYYLKK